MLRGIPVSPGIAIGKAHVLDSEDLPIHPRPLASEEEVEGEINRFETAVAEVKEEFVELRERLTRELGEDYARIFEAHRLVLEDLLVIGKTVERVKKERLNVEYVFSGDLRKIESTFADITDVFFRERMNDVRDVGWRILRKLLGKEREGLADLTEEVVVIAHDLSPADTAQMNREKVLAFATDRGGRTTHSALMARAMEMPAVVGLQDISRRVMTGDTVVVDGHHGTVIVNPDKETYDRFLTEKVKIQDFERKLGELRDLPAETVDGYRVELAANIALPEEVESVFHHGAESIGLYRTEFLFMNRREHPDEEEQFRAYRDAVERVKPAPVIVRTWDLGADQSLAPSELRREVNPFMGCRAIRFCLEHPELFLVQLRAILRASAYGTLKIMFPMISGVEEVRQVKELLERAKQELRQDNEPFDENMPVGVMIEIPAAAMTVDILAEEADFLSIGTNDLIQYSLAVDRDNERVAHLYETAHPAVLRVLRMIIDAAKRANIWVGMCGEMASNPGFAIILLGMGLDQLSMAPAVVPEIKRIVRSITLEEARGLADQVLRLSTPREIEEEVTRTIKRLVPSITDYELFDWITPETYQYQPGTL